MLWRSFSSAVLGLTMLGGVSLAQAADQESASTATSQPPKPQPAMMKAAQKKSNWLNLTPQQQQKIAAQVKAIRPMLNEVLMEMQANKRMLKAMVVGDFNQDKMQALADKQGQLYAKLLGYRLTMQNKLYNMLTPEQKEKFKQRMQMTLGARSNQ